MKLHFTYNTTDLNNALTLADQTAEYADSLGVGSLLLFKEGTRAIKEFKGRFPNKEIFAEAKITEKADEAVAMMAQSGANYISILAGTLNHTIKKAVATAKNFDTKIALDLLDAPSHGQSAMDAKSLGAHLLILHRPHGQEKESNSESDWPAVWYNVKDNTTLPIYITGKIDETNIQQTISLKPQGIMIGTALAKADNPAKMAHYFRSLM